MSTEVKSSYKLTELGLIPDDWAVQQLSQHFNIYAGGDAPRHSLSSIRSESHQYPIFANSLQNYGLYGYTNECRSKSDSLTITARGFLGHAEYRSEPFFPIVRLLVLEPIGGLDARFTTYVVNNRVKFSIESTGVPQLTAPQVGVYSIAAPTTITEQRAIATALSDMDALIGGLDQLIAKKRDIKQATMQQLLTGQTRLPGFSSRNQKFKKTPVGLFPDNWDVSPLIDLVDPERSIRYGIVQPGEYDQNGRYMIRGQDYSESKGWAKQSEVFRVSDAVEARYQNARVKAGDLIMTIVGYCGHVELIPSWLDGANLTQTTARIAIKPARAISAFCKYFLQSRAGKTQVAAYMKGAAQPGLNCSDVQRFIIVTPSLPEQAAIAGVLSDMDAELATLEARRDKAKQLKQGMMQELLTGRIRLI